MTGRTYFILRLLAAIMLASLALEPARAEMSAEQFHAIVRAKNPFYRDTGKITLQNGKIVVLSLSKAHVRDLSFIPQLPLEDAWVILAVNPLADLSPLHDASIKKLSLAACPGTLQSLAPLAGMQLEMLDINGNGMIRDITPLKGMPLKQLVMHNAVVADLTPLAGMQLEELRLTPNYVEQGWDIVRNMESLKILSNDWTPNTTPQEFFEKLNSGRLGSKVHVGLPADPSARPNQNQLPPGSEPNIFHQPETSNPGETPPSASIAPAKADRSKWSIKETELGPLAERQLGASCYRIQNVSGLGYFASPDQLRYATVGAERMPGTASDGVVYSIDGKRIGPVVTDYSHSLCFSPGWEHFAWQGELRGRTPNDVLPYVFLDGKMVKLAHVEHIPEVTFSSDGKAAWTGQVRSSDPGGQWFYTVWIDGKPVCTRYDAIRDLTFSPDGSQLAWWGWDKQREGRFLSVNGKEVSTDMPGDFPVSEIIPISAKRWIRFGPKGDLAYELTQGEDAWVIHEGRKGPRIHKAGPLIFSPDGKHLAYRGIRREGRDECIVIDGQVAADGRIVGTPCFSPDGTHHAYLLQAKTTGRPHLIVDGQKKGYLISGDLAFPFGDGHGDNAGNIVFSHDGTHIAFVHQVMDHVEVFVDDAKIDDFFAKEPSGDRCATQEFCPHSLTFSPDGHHLAFGLGSGEVWIDGNRLAYDHLPRRFRVVWDSNERLHFQAAKGGKATLVQVSLSGEPSSWTIRQKEAKVAKSEIDVAGNHDQPKLLEGDVPIPGARIIGQYTSSEVYTVYELNGVQFCVWPKAWRNPGSSISLMLLGTTTQPDTTLKICNFSVEHAAKRGAVMVHLSYFEFPQGDSQYLAWVRKGLETYQAWKKVAIENNVKRYDKVLPKYNPTNEPEWKFVDRTPTTLVFKVSDLTEDVQFQLFCERPHRQGRRGQVQLKSVVHEIESGNGAETLLAVLNNLDAMVQVHKYLADVQAGKAEHVDSLFRAAEQTADNSDTDDEPAPPIQPPRYKILSHQAMGAAGISAKVLVEAVGKQAPNEAQLKVVWSELNGKTTKVLSLSFYVLGMDPEKAGWATAFASDKNSVEIKISPNYLPEGYHAP